MLFTNLWKRAVEWHQFPVLFIVMHCHREGSRLTAERFMTNITSSRSFVWCDFFQCILSTIHRIIFWQPYTKVNRRDAFWPRSLYRLFLWSDAGVENSECCAITTTHGANLWSCSDGPTRTQTLIPCFTVIRRKVFSLIHWRIRRIARYFRFDAFFLVQPFGS